MGNANDKKINEIKERNAIQNNLLKDAKIFLSSDKTSYNYITDLRRESLLLDNFVNLKIPSQIMQCLDSKNILECSLDIFSNLNSQSMNHHVNSTLYHSITVQKLTELASSTKIDLEYLSNQASVVNSWLKGSLVKFKFQSGIDSANIDMSSIAKDDENSFMFSNAMDPVNRKFQRTANASKRKLTESKFGLSSAKLKDDSPSHANNKTSNHNVRLSVKKDFDQKTVASLLNHMDNKKTSLSFKANMPSAFSSVLVLPPKEDMLSPPENSNHPIPATKIQMSEVMKDEIISFKQPNEAIFHKSSMNSLNKLSKLRIPDGLIEDSKVESKTPSPKKESKKDNIVKPPISNPDTCRGPKPSTQIAVTSTTYHHLNTAPNNPHANENKNMPCTSAGKKYNIFASNVLNKLQPLKVKKKSGNAAEFELQAYDSDEGKKFIKNKQKEIKICKRYPVLPSEKEEEEIIAKSHRQKIKRKNKISIDIRALQDPNEDRVESSSQSSFQLGDNEDDINKIITFSPNLGGERLKPKEEVVSAGENKIVENIIIKRSVPFSFKLPNKTKSAKLKRELLIPLGDDMSPRTPMTNNNSKHGGLLQEDNSVKMKLRSSVDIKKQKTAPIKHISSKTLLNKRSSGVSANANNYTTQNCALYNQFLEQLKLPQYHLDLTPIDLCLKEQNFSQALKMLRDHNKYLFELTEEEKEINEKIKTFNFIETRPQVIHFDEPQKNP